MRGGALALTVAVLAAGCGSQDEPDRAADEACVVTLAGNELCGDSARAWCERFAVDTTDLPTIHACNSVDADTTSPEADQAAADERQREATVEERNAAFGAADDQAARYERALRRAFGPEWVERYSVFVEVEPPSDGTPATRAPVDVGTGLDRISSVTLRRICDVMAGSADEGPATTVHGRDDRARSCPGRLRTP